MPQMSNRKFRIIMQTVCIFRVIVVYFRVQEKRIPRRQLPQPLVAPPLPSRAGVSRHGRSSRAEPSLDQPHSFAFLPFPCRTSLFPLNPPPWPLLIIIEFLEIFTVKGKGNSPPDFCIRRQRTGCLMLAELPPHHPVPSPCLLFRRLTLCSIA